MKLKNINDVAKETLAVLHYLDIDLIKKVPKSFIEYLENLAEECDYEVNINIDKNLVDQNISEESKDLIALIYYSYIADEEEKRQIKQCWNKNDIIYEKKLEEKYNPNNIFKYKQKDQPENALIEIKKETLLNKIINYIRKFLKKHN